jgi:hypothetical protein
MGRALVAVNTAPESENRMHGDEARRFGFASGLVPGVDVLAYLAHEGVAHWGSPWLAGGRLQGRLDAPVYDGERVEVEVVEVADRLDVCVVGPDGAAPAYLDEISETHPAFRDGGCAHPGWLLRFANWALSGTVRLGPWIHVSSDASFLASVRDGDELEVRAIVTDRLEVKGHEFVDLCVLYIVEGSPVGLVDHRAIWQPRARRTDGT